jgi:tetratricopeptide (TPR) repeat protein
VGKPRLIVPVVGLMVAVLAFTTFTRAGVWGDKYTVIEFSLRNHPNSSRTHGEYATSNAQLVGDIELGFKHWARAAELNPSSVLELIEMDKLLAAQILAFEQQGARADTVSADYPVPTDFHAAPVPDLGYLKALDRILADEISTRLRTRPVAMSNVAALRTLEQCIRTNLAPCVFLLPRAMGWFELAWENPRVDERVRAGLRLGLAKLYAYDGQLEKAVESAQAAARGDPGQIQYLFELAALYLTLQDLDAAERTIAAADSMMHYSGFRHGVLRDLKLSLEQARKDQKGASSTDS